MFTSVVLAECLTLVYNGDNSYGGARNTRGMFEMIPEPTMVMVSTFICWHVREHAHGGTLQRTEKQACRGK